MLKPLEGRTMSNPVTISQTDHICVQCGRPMQEICTSWHPLLPMQCRTSCAACGTEKPEGLWVEMADMWSAWMRFFRPGSRP
jgi:hypothetical protein